jgi:hypothetical protein
MDSKNFAIGVLSTTAVILLVGLILLHAQPEPAFASGMGDRGGDYVMLSGSLWEQEELLYVLNTAEEKMITYKYNMQANQITPTAAQDLKRFLQPQQDDKDQGRGRGGRGRNP